MNWYVIKKKEIYDLIHKLYLCEKLRVLYTNWLKIL